MSQKIRKVLNTDKFRLGEAFEVEVNAGSISDTLRAVAAAHGYEVVVHDHADGRQALEMAFRGGRCEQFAVRQQLVRDLKAREVMTVIALRPLSPLALS